MVCRLRLPVQEVYKVYCITHDTEDIGREGCCGRVLTDHGKVPAEFYLCIQNDKENVEPVIPIAKFIVVVKGWEATAMRRG
jgi:hypothetical protein